MFNIRIILLYWPYYQQPPPRYSFVHPFHHSRPVPHHSPLSTTIGSLLWSPHPMPSITCFTITDHIMIGNSNTCHLNATIIDIGCHHYIVLWWYRPLHDQRLDGWYYCLFFSHSGITITLLVIHIIVLIPHIFHRYPLMSIPSYHRSSNMRQHSHHTNLPSLTLLYHFGIFVNTYYHPLQLLIAAHYCCYCPSNTLLFHRISLSY